MSSSVSPSKPLSSLARRSLGELTKKHYHKLILTEGINQGLLHSKDQSTIKDFLHDALDQKTSGSAQNQGSGSDGTPEGPNGDKHSSQSEGEPQLDSPSHQNHIKRTARRNRLGIKVKSQDEIVSELDTEKKDHKDQTIQEITQLFVEKAQDTRNFIAGMKEYLVVDEARKAIKEYDQMIDELRIKVMIKEPGYTNGYTTNIRAQIQAIYTEIKLLEELIKDKLRYQETSAVNNYYRRKDIAHRTRNDQFIIFDDRERIIHTAIEHLVAGEHVLIEGPTGGGKTIIADEISNRVKSKLGKSTYQGDGKTLSKLTNPEEFNTIVSKCVSYKISGHSRLNAQDLTVKLGLQGQTEVVEQVVGMLRAITEGVPFIIDEIDLIPNEVLMSIKALFTLKPGNWTIPDSGTGLTVYQIPRKPMLIATMNGASDKHKRNTLDPAMLRLFGFQTTLGYINEEQTYDYLVAQLFNEHDYIDGVAYNELSDKATGVVPALLSFIGMVNASYQGKGPITLPASIPGVSTLQKGFIKDKVIELGKLSTILSTRKGDAQGRSLTDYVMDEILTRCLGHANLEDAALLVRAGIVSGLISKTDQTVARIIAHKQGWTQETATKLFTNHMDPSPLKRNESHNLIVNAREIGLSDYVSDTTTTNLSKTLNKPSLTLGKHKKIIDKLNDIGKEMTFLTDMSLVCTIQGWQDLLKKGDNLTKEFNEVITPDHIGDFIKAIVDKIKGIDISIMNDDQKKAQLAKEKKLLDLLGAIPGGEQHIQDILTDERWKTVVDDSSQANKGNNTNLPGSPDTNPERVSNREGLSKSLMGDNLEQPATDRNGNSIPGKTNLQYIIDQCDEFMNNGGVTFDYIHNGIPGCTKFNIPTRGNNLFRPLFPTDLPQATTIGDHFAKLYDVDFIKPQINVYLRAMKNNKGEVTDTITDWIDNDGQGNHNYFKSFAQDYQDKGLTLNDKVKYNIFLDDLAKILNIKQESGDDKSGEDKKFAKVAYQYIMGNMIGRYRGSMRDSASRFALRLWEFDRWRNWGVDGGNNDGVAFAGCA